MSNIHISGPFTKAIYTSLYDDGRLSNNPLFATETDFEVTVPVPFRRINAIIQNQGTETVILGFDEGANLLTLELGIKLDAGQTLALDNYNGPIHAINGGAEGTSLLVISESFA